MCHCAHVLYVVPIILKIVNICGTQNLEFAENDIIQRRLTHFTTVVEQKTSSKYVCSIEQNYSFISDLNENHKRLIKPGVASLLSMICGLLKSSYNKILAKNPPKTRKIRINVPNVLLVYNE